MATFIKIGDRAAALLLIAAGVIGFAVVFPGEFASAVDSLWGAIDGAIQGASG